MKHHNQKNVGCNETINNVFILVIIKIPSTQNNH